MRNTALNVVIFLVLAGLMFLLWREAEKNIPKPAKKDDAKPEVVEKKDDKKDEAPKDAKAPEGPKEPPKLVAPPPPTEPPTLIALGDGTFYNRVLLTTQGGGVQQVVLPKFDQADRLGR